MIRKQGTCGGTPKRDGSGRGIGNRNTVRQPKPSQKRTTGRKRD